jgi:hypothetical protein
MVRPCASNVIRILCRPDFALREIQERQPALWLKLHCVGDFIRNGCDVAEDDIPDGRGKRLKWPHPVEAKTEGHASPEQQDGEGPIKAPVVVVVAVAVAVVAETPRPGEHAAHSDW